MMMQHIAGILLLGIPFLGIFIYTAGWFGFIRAAKVFAFAIFVTAIVAACVGFGTFLLLH